MLTAEERAELDELMLEAGYDNGKPRPSHEIGPRVVAMLRGADQASRSWAAHLLEDFLEDGALKRWKKWNAAREVVTVAGQSYITTKAAAMSVRKQDPESGRTYYQATFWDDMTREELEQVIARAAKQIESESRTVALAKRLLSLLERVPEAETVADAARALGLTTERYLAVVEAA